MAHPAASRLYHKDERQRRRAVRKLFEVNDPGNLGAFVGLLDDSETWYREKSMEAMTKWCGSENEKIILKLANSKYLSQRILATKLATRLNGNKNNILHDLCEDKEITVRISAWEEKLNVSDKEIGNLIKLGMKSEDKSIRKISMIRLSKMDHIENNDVVLSLDDAAFSVRNVGLEIIKNRPEINDNGEFTNYLIELASNQSSKGRNIAASILIERDSKNPEISKLIVQWSEEENIGFIRTLVKTLRKTEWWENNELAINITNNSSDAFVTRILRGVNSGRVTEIRNDILSGSTRGEDVKLRIIEDLIGRKIDQTTIDIIKQLDKGSSVFLSIASKELLEELS
ncbi:MAG: hypothetical protein ACI9EM_000415 [Candidatus Thalassarchaeaceae archaeon]|jgi:hypothetical protein|tara:strand:+ start:16304 stop:17332 length:1029 start_codon:yes stop_codon:yes gene_type:complete